MATINPTSEAGSGVRAVVENALSVGNHTFTYRPGTGQVLLYRGNGGTTNLRLSGADGVTWGVPGAGDLPVTPYWQAPNAGVGATRMICLDEVPAYLQGAITVAVGNGTAIVVLLNP